VVDDPAERETPLFGRGDLAVDVASGRAEMRRADRDAVRADVREGDDGRTVRQRVADGDDARRGILRDGGDGHGRIRRTGCQPNRHDQGEKQCFHDQFPEV